MPKQKDLKRRVRARMEKTGESYTAARARLIEKKAKRSADNEPIDHAALAGMSDEAVAAKTGRSWSEWVEELDRIEAAAMPHKEIAAHVGAHYEVSGWWAQTVTVGYERIKGLREIGQRRGGSYEANKSRTYPVPVSRLYRACRNARERVRWLPDVELEVRKATPDKSMRVTFGDGTAVELYFWSKGESKSQVQLQHRKLASKAAAEKAKAFWGERLTALGRVLEG